MDIRNFSKENKYNNRDQESIFQHKNMNYKEAEITTYTLKINSKNRNLLREPNPFNFEIIFNQEQTLKNSKAVITSKFENIKKIQLCEIVMPRYIPRDFIGEPFNGVTPLYNTPNSVTLSYYPGININNTNITMADNSVIEVIEIIDLSLKKIFIVADQYNDAYKLSKFMNLRADIYSYLNIDNNVYPILKIFGNIIYLDNTEYYPLPINTNNRLIIADFYKNITIMDETGLSISITNNSINIYKSNILNYQYIYQDQYLEYQVNTDRLTIFEKKLFKVSNIKTKLINSLLDPMVDNVIVIIEGQWTNGFPSNYKENTETFNNGKIIKISQFNYGIRDLLDEKVFYVNLMPFIPSKNVSTDPSLNNTFGILFASTQSKDYLFLRGEASETYANSNLQSTSNKITFSLMDSNNEQIGNIYNKFINLYNPSQYLSYFENTNTKKIKPDNITIRSYLPYYPDLTLIIKIDECERKINF